MNKYKITIQFNDPDDNFFTSGKAKMYFDLDADDLNTANHVGERIQNKFGADNFSVCEEEV